MILHASRPTPSFDVDHIVICVIMVLRATRIQLSSHSSHSHTTVSPPLASTVTPQHSHRNSARPLPRPKLLPTIRTSHQPSHPTKHSQLTPSQTPQRQLPPQNTTMGCNSSKPEYYDQPASRPPPPNGYPPQQQQQQPIQGGKTRKQKGVKAASNLGLLSILAG